MEAWSGEGIGGKDEANEGINPISTGDMIILQTFKSK